LSPKQIVAVSALLTDMTDNGKQKAPLQELPLEVKRRLRKSALREWYKNPGKRSREIDLTQEERDYLGRFVRWYRSLKRVEPPEGYGPSAEVYKGKPDPAFDYLVQIRRTPEHSKPRIEPRVEEWGYLQPRGFSRPLPVVILPDEDRRAELLDDIERQRSHGN
jgi:hypothetical protein